MDDDEKLLRSALAVVFLLVPLAGGQGAGELPLATGDADAPADEGLRAKLAQLEPAADGWSSEVLAREVGEQLVELAGRWGGRRVLGAEALAPLVAAELVCDDLRPRELVPVFESGNLRVLRHVPGSNEERTHRGPAGFVAALSGLAEAFGDGARVDFKVVGVTPIQEGEQAEGPRTTVLYQASGEAAGAQVQQTATWECTWRVADGDRARLLRVERVAFEEVVSVGGPAFRDWSAAVFGGAGPFEEQLVPGLAHWRDRVDASFGVSLLGHQGLALGDVDGDGLEDLFVCQPGGLPNRLYLREPDGSTRDVSAEAGLDFLDPTSSALLVDLDGDGDADLVAAIGGELLFLENDGEWETRQGVRFALRAAHPAPNATSLALADVDRDGDLDVYVCGYVSPYDHQGTPLPYHDACNGQPNLLLRNEGRWSFRDATRGSGLDVGNDRFSFAAAFEDVDNDGDQDLYVANDFGRNNLYRNEGDGHFTDIAGAAGVEDLSAGMGVTWGDYDRDGWMDLYVSNMFSAAGNRVAYQRRFQAAAEPEARAGFQRHARGNTLFRNTGAGAFTDTTAEAGVAMGRWAWGAIWLDLDNDGWLDLFVPNGFVTGARTHDL